jgi:dTDP-4-dehydrorhamnose reductase
MMRLLITGSGGMLGRDLVSAARTRGLDVSAYERAHLDVTDESAVREVLQRARPDVVVQCAAYTRVDDAEREEDEAFRINALGAEIVAGACSRLGALFVYPSTDYVFSGRGERPWRPTDPTRPLNAYGRTKLAGEVAALTTPRHLVVRTSWLYGAGGRNFVETVARLAEQRPELRVVDDQIGIPTWTGSLAATLLDLVEERVEGVCHATDGGAPVSWYDFAREIIERLRLPAIVRPIPSTEYAAAAERPAYSILDCSGTEARIGRPMVDWRESLSHYLGVRARPGLPVPSSPE